MLNKLFSRQGQSNGNASVDSANSEGANSGRPTLADDRQFDAF